MNKKYLEIFIYITFIILLDLCCIFKLSIFDAISYSVTLSLFLFTLYSKWLWKYNPLEKTPRLKKKYVAQIDYQYDGQARNKKVDVNIKQDLFSIKVTMKSDESFSKSIIANIYQEQDVWYLTYTYINEPSQKNRKKSKIHYGTCKLNLNDINKISGEYFTDRLSCGDIVFTG